MDAVTSEQRPTPRRRTLVLIVVPILAVIVVGNLGNLFHAPLLKEHPLWLAAMEPRNRYLLLVAEKVSFWPFLLVATARRLVSDPLFYLLGHLYGDRSVRWMERKMGEGGAVVRGIERAFKKVGALMVFFIPGMPVCILAGATGMSPILFLTVNVVGTVTVVTLLYQLAEVLSGPLGAINRFYGNNTLALFVITAVLMGYWLWDQRRRGRSELQPLSEIEKELEAGSEAQGPPEERAAAEAEEAEEAEGESGGRSGLAGRPEHG